MGHAEPGTFFTEIAKLLTRAPLLNKNTAMPRQTRWDIPEHCSAINPYCVMKKHIFLPGSRNG
jgi:hypothetical protein